MKNPPQREGWAIKQRPLSGAAPPTRGGTDLAGVAESGGGAFQFDFSCRKGDGGPTQSSGEAQHLRIIPLMSATSSSAPMVLAAVPSVPPVALAEIDSSCRVP